MKASLIATIPTPGLRYQHGSPLLVILESMISSLTRKKAWSSSVIQPRAVDSRVSSSLNGRPTRIETESGTDIPRLSLPVGVLVSRFCERLGSVSVTIQ